MIHSVGIDIVEIVRMRDALARHPTLAARLFTPEERAYCEQHTDPVPYYAARFAAKEAAVKAAGRHLRWQEVVVIRGAQGKPSLTFSGDSAEWAGCTRGAEFLLSISHSCDYAVAIVIQQFPPHWQEAPYLPKALV